jgi:hypothetical protein
VGLEELGELRHGVGAVLRGHAFGAGADANLDHASFDGIGDVDASLKAGRALSVQRLDGGCDRESGSESGGAELGCATAGGEDGADSDVFDEVGVDFGALDEGFEGAAEEVGGLRVFEASFAAFGEGGAKGACNDDLESG